MQIEIYTSLRLVLDNKRKTVHGIRHFNKIFACLLGAYENIFLKNILLYRILLRAGHRWIQVETCTVAPTSTINAPLPSPF